MGWLQKIGWTGATRNSGWVNDWVVGHRGWRAIGMGCAGWGDGVLLVCCGDSVIGDGCRLDFAVVILKRGGTIVSRER